MSGALPASSPPSPDIPGKVSRLAALDFSILQTCIHCGMCLPTCPTYDETKNENSSPRGRIAMMKAVAAGESRIGPHFAKEMYYCLGCLACQTACPADVRYAPMLEAARADVEASGLLATPRRSFARRFLMTYLFASRRRLRAVARLLWIAQRSGLQAAAKRLGLIRLMSTQLADLEPLSPAISLPFTQMGYITKSHGGGPRVALLAGCVQDIAFADVNRATVEVLERIGCRVVIPPKQQCCGSLHAHNGDIEGARALARVNLDAMDPCAFDAIITNAAGCGSHIRHYRQLLSDDPVYRYRAAAWDHRIRDINEYLVEQQERWPKLRPTPESRQKLAYQDACHLVHGQRIAAAPRRLLKSLATYEWVDLPESTWCCGSAGVYNITQPEQARKLGVRKAGHISDTGAAVLAVANPGCMGQIRAMLKERNLPIRVAHPVTLIAEEWRNHSEA
ncbi:MAG TPA: (Fe-S)-binding protein [Kiritimatiellia bacterium]|nr:(Fe-S)-binding protein [Kiritimatiellia bacterium]